MARLMFGAGIADWTMAVDGVTGAVTVAPNSVVTFYDSQAGGNQYTDLTDLSGSNVLSSVTSNASGQIPAFMGPDGVFEMWASAAGGTRALVFASNLGSYLGPVRTSLEAHVAGSDPNPHGTTVASLTDVTGAGTKQTGQVLAVDATGKWTPATVAGVGGSVQIAGDETISGKKTFENQASNTVRVAVNAAESQSVDVFQVWSAAATGQGGAKTKTSWFNNKGEARFSPAKSDSVGVQIVGQSGQTANVFEQVSNTGIVLARMEANGAWRAPNVGRSVQFTKAGALALGAGSFSWFNDTGVPATIRSVRATVGTSPAGAAIIVDVNVNGTTIFSTQANRPTIAAAAKTSGKVTGFSTVVIPDGASVTVDVDQVGAVTPGSDLAVQVDVY